MTMLALLFFLSIPVTHRQAAPAPSLVEVKPKPSSLTLYNEQGEQVAICTKTDDGETFTDCKITVGYTLDDLMNAWVHAYEHKDDKEDK
jgi:hypothetical protein